MTCGRIVENPRGSNQELGAGPAPCPDGNRGLRCAAVFRARPGGGAGMLRGLQDTRVPMVYAALGYWGIGMSLSLLFGFAAGLRGLGIWIGLVVALVVVACALMQRWIRRERLGLVRAR